MIIDACNEFFVHQPMNAATVSAVVDLGNRGTGATHIPLLLQVTEAATGGGSLEVIVEGSDDKDFTVKEVLASTGDVAVQSLRSGFQLPLAALPKSALRYMRLSLVPNDINSGTISAAVVADLQDAKV